MRFGHHDQSGHRGCEFRQSGVAQTLFGHGRAALYIAPGFGIIDGIMKPEGEFNGARLLCQVSGLVEFREAFGDVLLGVVVALRFGISLRQRFIPMPTVAASADALPEVHPSLLIRPVHKFATMKTMRPNWRKVVERMMMA